MALVNLATPVGKETNPRAQIKYRMGRLIQQITHDDYLRIEGAKMMARAIAEFISSTRTSNANGTISANTMGCVGEDGNPNTYIKGITTDMLLDAVVRLTANTFDCHSFIYGDYPTNFDLQTKEKNGKHKPTRITFKY